MKQIMKNDAIECKVDMLICEGCGTVQAYCKCPENWAMPRNKALLRRAIELLQRSVPALRVFPTQPLTSKTTLIDDVNQFLEDVIQKTQTGNSDVPPEKLEHNAPEAVIVEFVNGTPMYVETPERYLRRRPVIVGVTEARYVLEK